MPQGHSVLGKPSLLEGGAGATSRQNRSHSSRPFRKEEVPAEESEDHRRSHLRFLLAFGGTLPLRMEN
jgi:hypothetical protein